MSISKAESKILSPTSLTRKRTRFHVNPRLRTTLFTATDIQSRTEVDGEKVEGSGGNAVRFGAGIDWLIHDATSLNFNAVFGATDRAPDAVLTAGVTYRF